MWPARTPSAGRSSRIPNERAPSQGPSIGKFADTHRCSSKKLGRGVKPARGDVGQHGRPAQAKRLSQGDENTSVSRGTRLHSVDPGEIGGAAVASDVQFSSCPRHRFRTPVRFQLVSPVCSGSPLRVFLFRPFTTAFAVPPV